VSSSDFLKIGVSSVGGPKMMDPRSRPDGEPQDEMSLFTSHGREEVLTTIKSAQNMRSQE
jgi:hypothetical protein